jgi:hypothetical protein
LRKHFQRDVAIQSCIAGSIHLAHSARTEPGSHFVGTKASA